ncbi:MAG: 4'-phosphopantetheinyl transferase family protein [Solirubrobacteraceae bacterium]
MVALLVGSGRAVGVDVEEERRFDRVKLDLRLLGRSEAAALSRLAPQRRPTRLAEHWALKEALAKALIWSSFCQQPVVDWPVGAARGSAW